MTSDHPATRRNPTRRLAREVLINGPISRGELADRLGLSAASLTRLSKPLLDSGLLRETEDSTAGTVGRPTKPLESNPDAHHFIGIKLTAHSAAAVATNLRCEVLASAEMPLRSLEVEAVVSALTQVAAAVGDLGSFSGIGISIGGTTSPDGRVLRAPFLQWRDVPLARLVQSGTGLPVVLENDVVALTVAEQWFGAGRDEPNFAVLTVGAGVGYGLVINGNVIAPPDAGLGLIGHYPLDSAAPRCAQCDRGCASTRLTIASITAQAQTNMGKDVEYGDILELSRRSDPAATAIVSAAGAGLGTLLAAIANLTMVDLIILSGEGVDLADAGAESMERAMHFNRDPEATPIRLFREPADFTQWARGAAAVAIQRSILGSLPLTSR